MLTQADVHWIELDSVDSTNDYLTRAYQQSRVSGCVAVLAHAQTAGRGRSGRSWQSAPGASLCLSLGMPLAGYQLPFLPLCVGVAVAQVLEMLNLPVRLKWPNDLLIDDQKLGGVLCESFQTDGGPVTVMGVGLNLLPMNVPDALSGQGATSLAASLPEGATPSALTLAQSIIPSVLNLINQAQQQGVAAVFNLFTQRDAWLGREVQVLDQGEVCYMGKAMGINEHGAYLVNTTGGLRALNAGDLSLRVNA
ncbi:biotin--[acetyl-CoA-carboxylase] ligase [Limnobacter parvus]|uniref:biotin--[biotin carboxyl-carrier protein] ligase n=1 Tax=Limnobacter parvus TaxID=2939690 RepID=A0ABT1XIH9_9BURK|nr:biotin--[acetyl-CoA-carboxylase] ligase [Limnobacter parvus]MCR2747080.1 biotin--[acetyl-CoA-carboxylase] ligase [Limnobacter parvus]